MKPATYYPASLWICLCLVLLPLWVFGQVVINEVCYDPTGVDSGKEWIELYNAGNNDVNLAGAKLFSGGSNFVEVFEFPAFILRARRYLLIGDTQVTQAVFTVPLAFQNGGAETDGIRYLGPDGFYSDTVLYDSPNSNNLTDDTGFPGVSFAPDVPEGYSLARRINGYDTNDCAADFCAEASPTPGLPNPVYVDYALLHPQIWQEGDIWQFGVWVKNLCDLSPVVNAELRIYLDGLMVAEHIVSDLTSGDSLHVVNILPVYDAQNHQISALLELENDPDLANNSLNLDLFLQNLEHPVINEVMFHPDTGKQEWIELWVDSSPARGDYMIRDATGNECGFSLPGCAGYFVLCAAPEQLLLQYPDCPASGVIKTSGWAVLNNDGDSILLLDLNSHSLDQMSYTGSNSQQGKSLERYLPASQQVQWRYSLDSSGSTPGRANSQSVTVPDFQGSLRVEGSPCNPQKSEIIRIYYKLDSPQNRVNCKVFDHSGCLIRILADYTLIPGEGVITWDGKNSAGKIVPRGRYFFVWESQPTDGKKSLREQFTAEIFYGSLSN